MKKIPLTQGQYAIVDDSDFEYLSQWKWYAHKTTRSNTFYAIRNTYEKGTGRRGVVRMHNEILGRSDELVCDHLNRDGLDNRRNNLRLVTRSENARNKHYPKVLKAARGVAAINKGGFSARGLRDGKRVYIGYFKTIPEAEEALRKFEDEV